MSKIDRLKGANRRSAAAHASFAPRRQAQGPVIPVVALVGYTNAGKSTLFNRLTGAGVLAQDKLFATLDPTMRGIKLPSGRRAVLSDTVGFITDLPTDLIAAFRATLEEVLEADVLLHVRAVDHPDNAAQAEDVEQVLNSLGIDETDRERLMLEAWNKSDALDPEVREDVAAMVARQPNATLCSAISGEGLEVLLSAIDAKLAADHERVELVLDHNQGAVLSFLHEQGRIIERRDEADGIHLAVELSPLAHARLRERLSG